eukprot:7738778-Lingulodinium_polyedra.AAC.1
MGGGGVLPGPHGPAGPRRLHPRRCQRGPWARPGPMPAARAPPGDRGPRPPVGRRWPPAPLSSCSADAAGRRR